MIHYLWRWSALAALTILMANFSPLLGDEGMWLFNNPPKAHLKAKYNFEPTDAWLNHLQKSSVRFNSGGSGSFVSANGLVMTNHHVAADALQKMGTKDRNYYRSQATRAHRDTGARQTSRPLIIQPSRPLMHPHASPPDHS